ncbi:GGDEF domain-containing protein [Enterovibrio sp. Hal110]
MSIATWSKPCLEKARRECTALVIDIDHFKRINDTFGHEMGDRILIEVATLLKNRSMSTDIAVRWGAKSSCFSVLIETSLRRHSWRKNPFTF